MNLLNLSPANSLPTLNNPARTVMFKRSITLIVQAHRSTEQKENRVVVQIFTRVSLSISATTFRVMQDKKKTNLIFRKD